MFNIIFGAACLLTLVAILSFAATRTHMFHTALTKRQQQSLNNAWLLEQCMTPEFYSNMKHHSSLCDDLVLEQADALWLHALRDVIDETRLCGEQHCIQRVENFLMWMLSRGVFVLCAVAASVFVLLLVVVQFQRYMWCEKYRMLYGTPNIEHLRGSMHARKFLHQGADYRLLENEDEGVGTLRLRTGGQFQDI
jgi:hypothetical protein